MSLFLTDLIEKAQLLAASGRYLSISDIRNHLHREGFTHFELTALNGKVMRRQLRRLIDEANATRRKRHATPEDVPPIGEM